MFAKRFSTFWGMAWNQDQAVKAVVVVHNETATGVTSDVAGIRKALNDAKHPALLMVDTISSLGSIDYRHDEWQVDVTVGVQEPDKVDTAKIKASLPHGIVTVQAVKGPDIACSKKYDCSNQGIQKGWSDLYGNALDCQWLDITGVPSGALPNCTGRNHVSVEVIWLGMLLSPPGAPSASTTRFTFGADPVDAVPPEPAAGAVPPAGAEHAAGKANGGLLFEVELIANTV